MAKSLRSKRKRKVRAEKRIVNAKKELIKLKEVAAKLHQVSAGAPLNKEQVEAEFPDVSVNQEPMAVEGQLVSKKDMTRINNQWMNQRKIKQIKGKIKRHNKKKSQRGGSSGLSSRKTKKSLRGR